MIGPQWTKIIKKLKVLLNQFPKMMIILPYLFWKISPTWKYHDILYKAWFFSLWLKNNQFSINDINFNKNFLSFREKSWRGCDFPQKLCCRRVQVNKIFALVFCFKYCSPLLWEKHFYITGTIYLNSESLKQFLKRNTYF